MKSAMQELSDLIQIRIIDIDSRLKQSLKDHEELKNIDFNKISINELEKLQLNVCGGAVQNNILRQSFDRLYKLIGSVEKCR